MAYSRLSTRVSDYLVRELNYPDEKRDIISYSLDTLFLFVAGYILILTLGWSIGIPGATLCALLSGDILRKFSGGAHFTTPYCCIATSAVTYPLVSWLAVQAVSMWKNEPVFNITLVIICITCLLIVSIYAPVDCPAKPIVSPSFKKKLKIASILLAFFFSIMVLVFRDTYIGVSIAGGLTIQSTTLLPFFNKK